MINLQNHRQCPAGGFYLFGGGTGAAVAKIAMAKVRQVALKRDWLILRRAREAGGRHALRPKLELSGAAAGRIKAPVDLRCQSKRPA
jgi:hypothetical protein